MNEKFRKQALQMFSYGVYILTSKFENNYCAATVTWVSQTSFEPLELRTTGWNYGG